LAKWDALRSAQSAGHEIGNHTLTHPRLDGLGDADVEREIQGAHDRLIEEGLHPRSVCYPYGAYDDRSLKAAENAGYKVGMAVRAAPGAPLLALPRVVVAYSDSLPLLLYKLKLRPLLRKTRGRSKP
jgi:peptidoglycan/xylan/chitin deacetylase (PgdA/CDA1 family)